MNTSKKVSKPSVTIAVSAYNEEKNIGNFLRSVLDQKEAGFTLDAIWIFSDGSTDKTVDVAGSFTSRKVKIFSYAKRIGKSSRLNQIYQRLRSDILVQSDADVVFKHPYVVRDIVIPLINDARVYMCGGNPQPIPGKTFIEKSVNLTSEVYRVFRKSIRGGNNIFSADGRLLAYRNKFIKGVHIPKTMIANDAFTYFSCLTAIGLYRYAHKAVVLYRSPQTVMDQVKQNTRFLAARERMTKYFSPDVVDNEYMIPHGLYLRTIIAQAFSHPVHSIVIFMINRFCYVKSSLVEGGLTGIWSIAKTTKIEINRI